MNNISMFYLLIRDFMIDFCLLGFGIVMHGLIHLNLLVNMFIWMFYIKDIIFFLNLLVRRSTLVRHTLWVRGGCHVSNLYLGLGRYNFISQI